MSLETLRQLIAVENMCYWAIYGDGMAKTCHFCHFINGWVCDGTFDDCIDCGKCKTLKEK